MMKVTVYPRGGRDAKPYVDALLALRDDLAGNDVELEVIETREPTVAVALLVSVAGSVATHLLTKLVDVLLARIRKTATEVEGPEIGAPKVVPVIVVLGPERYHLPEDETRLRGRIAAFDGNV
jgi:hypothetical protein